MEEREKQASHVAGKTFVAKGKTNYLADTRYFTRATRADAISNFEWLGWLAGKWRPHQAPPLPLPLPHFYLRLPPPCANELEHAEL